jgi:hypothetical protein
MTSTICGRSALTEIKGRIGSATESEVARVEAAGSRGYSLPIFSAKSLVVFQFSMARTSAGCRRVMTIRGVGQLKRVMISEPRRAAILDLHSAELPRGRKNGTRETSPLRVAATRLARAVAVFANSEAGWKAKWLFAALLALLLAANGLTVVNSFVGRNFMTAIADRREAEFVRQAMLYVGVFAASTIVAVVARFAEERLGLLWRDSLTRDMLKHYLANGAYSRSAVSGEVANPDQRIAEDARAFTTSTLSFALMAFNSIVTILAF